MMTTRRSTTRSTGSTGGGTEAHPDLMGMDPGYARIHHMCVSLLLCEYYWVDAPIHILTCVLAYRATTGWLRAVLFLGGDFHQI